VIAYPTCTPWRAHPAPQSDRHSRISNLHQAIRLSRSCLLRSTESPAKFPSLIFFGFPPNSVGRCKSHFARPLFSWSYELLFPQLFCFDTYLRCPPGVGCALRFQPQVLCVSGLKTYLSPFLTYCCELLVVAKKINSSTINQIQTLLPKYPGWGVCSARIFPAIHCPLLLCFFPVIASATAVPRAYCTKHLSQPPFPGRTESLFRALPVSQRSGGNSYGNY
jgi:hypothetical protein